MLGSGRKVEGERIANFKNSTRVRLVKTILVLSQSNMPIGDLGSLAQVSVFDAPRSAGQSFSLDISTTADGVNLEGRTFSRCRGKVV